METTRFNLFTSSGRRFLIMKQKTLSIRKTLSENKRMKAELEKGKVLAIDLAEIPNDMTINDVINTFLNTGIHIHHSVKNPRIKIIDLPKH
jgi:hypothetical protein